MDRISNYDTNKFVYLIVHLINFLTKINIILKKKKLKLIISFKKMQRIPKKKEEEEEEEEEEETHEQFQLENSFRLKAHSKSRKVKWKARLWG